MTLALALLIPAGLGFLTILMIAGRHARISLLEIAVYAFPVGMGLVTYQMFVLGLLRVPLKLLPILLLVLAEMGLLACSRRTSSRVHPLLPETAYRQAFQIDKRLIGIAEGISLLWIGVKLVTIFIEAGLRPIQAWDSWANWSARAKVFYYAHSLLLDVQPDILGKGLIDVNSNYPLLNAMSQVWMALWAGRFDEVSVKLWAPFFLLAAALHLFIVGAREINRTVSLCMVALFLSSPLLALHATEAYSDLLLAVYLLFALSSFHRAIQGEKIHLVLTGLFATLAMFTKDEGLFFALPLLVSCATFLWLRSDRRTFLKRVAACSAPCLFILPWYFCKLYYKLGMGADYVVFSLTFRPDVLFDYLRAMVNLANFNVLLIYLPIMLMISMASNRNLVYLSFPIAAYALFFVCLYACTTFFSQSIMFQTAVFRNTLTYYPAACLLTVFCLKEFLAANPPRSETD